MEPLKSTTQLPSTDPSIEMTPVKENQTQDGAREKLTYDNQIVPHNVSSSTGFVRPRTPENREAPRINLPPRPKSDLPQGKEQQSPTQDHVYRTRHRRNDSGYASREISIDRYFVEDKTVARSDVNAPELPRTPTRNNAAYREESNCRTASPNCPSLDRSRRQSRYYRVRSPTHQRPVRILFTVGDFLGCSGNSL
jgi:hypothetical protein